MPQPVRRTPPGLPASAGRTPHGGRTPPGRCSMGGRTPAGPQLDVARQILTAQREVRRAAYAPFLAATNTACRHRREWQQTLGPVSGQSP